MRMVVAGVRCVLVAVVVVGVGPPAASAVVVRERVVDFGQFDGDRCGDESSVELDLGLGPATVTSISPREPGTVFAERDTLAPVARLERVSLERAGRRRLVRFVAVGGDDLCARPELYPDGWATRDIRFSVRYRRRVEVVWCATESYCRRRPRTLYFGASGYLPKVRWTSWNGRVARGRALFPYNDCIPYCAAGNVTFYPAAVKLSGATRCSGRYVYLTLRWRVLGRPPPAGRTGRVNYDWLC